MAYRVEWALLKPYPANRRISSNSRSPSSASMPFSAAPARKPGRSAAMIDSYFLLMALISVSAVFRGSLPSRLSTCITCSWYTMMP